MICTFSVVVTVTAADVVMVRNTVIVAARTAVGALAVGRQLGVVQIEVLAAAGVAWDSLATDVTAEPVQDTKKEVIRGDCSCSCPQR